jgi:3-deoxy-7-phosphoheptulonate synthase
VILVLNRETTTTQADAVVAALAELGCTGRTFRSGARLLIEASGAEASIDSAVLEAWSAVERVIPVSDEPHRPVPAGQQTVPVEWAGGLQIGDRRIAVIAGPCSVEDETQIMAVADAVAAAGATALRGGAFKPRTNPYSFQGLGPYGLELLSAARERTGLAIVTEVMSTDHIDVVLEHADVLQIGTRNMHNFALLSAVGASGKPVLLKRGWSASLDELLHAAEYVVQAGSEHVVLCERGIRTFESYVRNTLALGIVPAVKQQSHWPIIVDPSQGTGNARFVADMSKAAIACGADGLLIEVHPEPARALTDGDQSLDIPQFQTLMRDLAGVAEAVGRSI